MARVFKLLQSYGIFEHKEWQDNINLDFFEVDHNPYEKIKNNYFTKQYLTKRLGNAFDLDIYGGDLVLDLAKILEGYPENAIDLLVRTDPLYILVADDTFVGAQTSLELSVEINPCVSNIVDTEVDRR